jgi:oxygen-independent coproporphyrinogen-3 oxidase
LSVATSDPELDIPLGLYIHLPWCLRKCPYCDFNSHEAAEDVPFDRYVDALLADLETELDSVQGRRLATIFIGGGTPSLFSGAAINRLLDRVRGAIECADDIEITLEANPGAADAARFEAYLAAGVNRLSIGVQSFRDRQLVLLGRVHDAAAAHAALAAARAAGCQNVNIDLMHGLPADEANDSLADLAEAIAFAPEHISWYQLTLEPGTAFAHKPPKLPQHDAVAYEFELGTRILDGAGYGRYEISAYARPGSRARHNLNYWEFGDYVGIGAGAHGKLTCAAGVFRTQKRRSPLAYMAHAGTPQCTTRNGPLEQAELVAEFAMNALRLRHGYAESLFTARTGLPQAAASRALEQACERGWIVHEGRTIRPTEVGYRFLNDLQLLFLD